MKQLLLIGGGHAHLAVMRDLAERPIPDTKVTLITPQPFQWYSGMIPGFMAGHYSAEECRIDLRSLIKQSGVDLILEPIIGFDANRQCVCLPDGTHIDYDILSLDVGGATDTSWLSVGRTPTVPIKPLDAFIHHWGQIKEQAKVRAEQKSSYHLAVVGAGAAGIELVLAAQYALAQYPSVRISLVGTPGGLLLGHGAKVKQRIQRVLADKNVTFHPYRAVATEEGLLLSSGDQLTVDCVLASTGAIAHEWLQLSHLALDDSGFVSVDEYHRCLSHDNVFAVGDVCSRVDGTVVRSGVHAVKVGPVLAKNLRAAASNHPLLPYTAKRNSLYLLSCGDRYGVMSWGNMSASGGWVWRWKDYIDRRFVAYHS
ncbi:hypothetical protein A9Q99_15570 [Gammaproteobacteria bacterium 45_16_T64]|nr:hypothetical protein A9Q99_15570 [Gammaproteobacteria bacterium 45_16_T64]